MNERVSKDQDKLDFVRDWIFSGTVVEEFEFNKHTIKMHLLDSKDEMEASQLAARRVGNDVDRLFWVKLETLALAIDEIDGKTFEPKTSRNFLEITPAVIVRQLYNEYLEKLETPQGVALKQVPN